MDYLLLPWMYNSIRVQYCVVLAEWMEMGVFQASTSKFLLKSGLDFSTSKNGEGAQYYNIVRAVLLFKMVINKFKRMLLKFFLSIPH